METRLRGIPGLVLSLHAVNGGAGFEANLLAPSHLRALRIDLPLTLPIFAFQGLSTGLGYGCSICGNWWTQREWLLGIFVRHGILTILWPAQLLCSRKGIEFHPTSAQALCDPWSHSGGFLHPKGDADRWGMVAETLRMLHEKADERTGSRSSSCFWWEVLPCHQPFPGKWKKMIYFRCRGRPHSWLPKEMRGEGLSFCAENRQSPSSCVLGTQPLPSLCHRAALLCQQQPPQGHG